MKSLNDSREANRLYDAVVIPQQEMLDRIEVINRSSDIRWSVLLAPVNNEFANAVEFADVGSPQTRAQLSTLVAEDADTEIAARKFPERRFSRLLFYDPKEGNFAQERLLLNQRSDGSYQFVTFSESGLQDMQIQGFNNFMVLLSIALNEHNSSKGSPATFTPLRIDD